MPVVDATEQAHTGCFNYSEYSYTTLNIYVYLHRYQQTSAFQITSKLLGIQWNSANISPRYLITFSVKIYTA